MMSRPCGGVLCSESDVGNAKNKRFLVATVVVALLLLTAPLAWGDYVVQTTSDSVSNPAPGSLRYEIYAAEAVGGGTVDASGVTGTITLKGEIDIQTAPVTINGPTGGTLAVSGNLTFRVFVIGQGIDGVAINNLTIENGDDSGQGGGIYVMLNADNFTMDACTITGCQAPYGGGICTLGGDVTLTNCTITQCTASGGSGGGGAFTQGSGTLHVTNCTFSGDSTTQDGGSGAGLHVAGGTVKVDDSTFVGNHVDGAHAWGGGMYCSGASTVTVTVTNSTFTDNTTSGSLWYYGGGGIDNDGPSLTVTNCTFTGNETSSSSGGGLFNYSGTTEIYDTILWGDTSGELGKRYGTVTVADCVVDGGYSAGANIITADPLLGTPGNYGGDTETFPLLPGSSAIDAGNTETATNNDQRGVSRSKGSAPDIGAFESQGFTLSIQSGNNQSATVDTAFTDPLVVGVTADDNPTDLALVDGDVVTFAVQTGSAGAAATLTGSPATISGGAAGVTAAANHTAGAYQVNATTAGADNTASFDLTNALPPVGDVDGDGMIDILDVRLCLQIAEGVIQGTASQRQQADMDGDGQVTLVDAQMLADYVVGMTSTSP